LSIVNFIGHDDAFVYYSTRKPVGPEVRERVEVVVASQFGLK
jgi:hypothetical protein